LLNQGQKQLGIRTIYTITDNEVPAIWPGEKGIINTNMLNKYVPDYKERLFYLSGPHAMVTAYAKLLSGVGIKNSQIKKDFFPGYV